MRIQHYVRANPNRVCWRHN